MLAIFEGLEDLIKKISEFSDCSRALITLASAVGILIFFFYAIYFTYKLIIFLRLYVISQYCCKVNFVKKYGQWALVTGATDGIGLSFAKELARRGMSILVVSRNEEKLANTKTLLEQIPEVGEVVTVQIDMSDSSAENFDKIRAQIDPDNRDIGVLINNAGSFPDRYARFNRFEIQEMLSLVNLNVLGTVHLTRMVMPGMIKRGKGLIMNVSSIIGEIPGAYFNLYAPTKTFVNSFTEQLQMEYRAHPLDIVLLKPGPVHTKLLRATSKISKPSFLIPTPDEYAKTSLNALSAGVSEYTGNFMHQIMKNQTQTFHSWGLSAMIWKLAASLNGKNYSMSPVPKRKKVVIVSAQDTSLTVGGMAEETVENSTAGSGSAK